MTRLATIEGIGVKFTKTLSAEGITSCERLLATGATRRGRRQIADACGIADSLVLEWINRADLMRIKGISTQYTDLLEVAGVDTVKELRRRNAASLTAKLAEVNSAKRRTLVRQCPAQSQVQQWIDHAKDLNAVVKY